MKIWIRGQNPTEDEIEDMIDDADEDGSGSINFPEFVSLMMKKQEGSISKDEIKQVGSFKKAIPGLFFAYFRSFHATQQNINCRLQLDSNSDRRSWRVNTRPPQCPRLTSIVSSFSNKNNSVTEQNAMICLHQMPYRQNPAANYISFGKTFYFLVKPLFDQMLSRDQVCGRHIWWILCSTHRSIGVTHQNVRVMEGNDAILGFIPSDRKIN